MGELHAPFSEENERLKMIFSDRPGITLSFL